MSDFIRILHQAVGPWTQGTVIRRSRLNDDQIEHLVAAGAIADADDAQGEMAGGRMLTLDETMRWPSSFTLPNIPYTDVDPDTVRSKMGVSRETAAVTTARTVQADANSSIRQREGELSPSGKSHLEPQVAEALHAEQIST